MAKARVRDRTNGGPRVRNEDMTDREMLAAIARVCSGDPDGYAATTEIGLALGFGTNGSKHMTPATKVGSRLGWMRDGGLLMSTDPDMSRPATEPGARDRRWALTDVGRQILQGSLSKTVVSAIERLDPGAQVLMMRELTRKGFVEAETATAFAVTREYRHNYAKRRLILR